MNKIGIYLHLPFCRRRCLYCDFYSTQRTQEISAYTRALCRHLREARERFGPHRADTLYLGGGTPSLLTVADLSLLIDTVNQCFPLTEDAEITLEANPATLCKESLPALGAMGINRISLGMQSGNDQELKAIGRLHSVRDTLRTAQEIREALIPHLSVDLMYALPHQTLKSWEDSLHLAVQSGADHISAYCLTLSPQSPLAQRDFPQADEDEQLQMYLTCCSLLEAEGLQGYEISNFAREGCQSQHNLKYWLRQPTLAFGASAWSFYDRRRWSMAADLDRVMTQDYFSLFEQDQTLSPEDEVAETVMLSLRLRRGLSLAALDALGSPQGAAETKARIQARLPALLKQGLVQVTPEGFCLTPRGAFVSNAILADLI